MKTIVVSMVPTGKTNAKDKIVIFAQKKFRALLH